MGTTQSDGLGPVVCAVVFGIFSLTSGMEREDLYGRVSETVFSAVRLFFIVLSHPSIQIGLSMKGALMTNGETNRLSFLCTGIRVNTII